MNRRLLKTVLFPLLSVTLLIYYHLFVIVPTRKVSLLDRFKQEENASGREQPKEELIGTGEDTLASELHQHIRIACWVMTRPLNHETQARSVARTWGRRCNYLFFVSTAIVRNETTVLYPGRESRRILWGKTKLGFRYAYDNYFEEADWFVKADDDTYMIIENLRFFLLDKNPSKPVYYGCKFKPFVKQGYMSGGAGYVLSREALRRFVEESVSDPTKCRQNDRGAEDAEMGKCLEKVGVEAGDSRDHEGSSRFFPFKPQDHVSPNKPNYSSWYWKYITYKHAPGIHCCSDSAIAFHYIDSRTMWAMEYLVYHLHPFGIHPELTGSVIKDEVIRYLRSPQRNWTMAIKSVPTLQQEYNDGTER